MQFFPLALELLSVGFRRLRIENRGGFLRHDFLPVGDLNRVNAELAGDFLDGLIALEGLQGHAGLELGIMSSAFLFHGVLGWDYTLPRTPQS